MTMLHFISVLAVIVAIVLFASINAYYLYIHRKYAHLPTPKGAGFYTGHVPIIVDQIKQGKYVLDTFKKWADECGPVYVYWKLCTPAVVVAHPEIIQEIGTRIHPKSDLKPLKTLWNRQRFSGHNIFTIQHHHDWKDRRRMYDPFFNKQFLENLIPAFNSVVKEHVVDYLKSLADGKAVVGMRDVFRAVTLEIITCVAFGVDAEDEYITRLCGSQNLIRIMDLSLEGAFLEHQYPIIPYIKPFGGYQYTDAVAKLRKICHYCIEKRLELMKHCEQTPQDILTQIIAISQSDTSTIQEENIVDDCMVFYIAGSDTSANTLSFALIVLLQTPEILERLEAEIDEVVGDSAVIDKSHLDKLEYMQAIIEETLRLHPPAPFVGKLTAEEICTNDYRIPKNTHVMCSAYLSHNDPEHFDNPQKFDPSRFEAGQKRPSPYVYMPFGIGHRSCIGRIFAMIEMKIILVVLLKNFKLSLPKGYELKKLHTFLSRPADKIPCTIKLKV